MTLWELAQEYRASQQPIERRLEDLRLELCATASKEVQRKLRQRIDALEIILIESRRSVAEMEGYYEKKESNPSGTADCSDSL